MKIETEYEELNKAAEIHCRPGEEFEAAKFLSPAVLENCLTLLEQFPNGAALEFFRDYALVVTPDDFFDGLCTASFPLKDFRNSKTAMSSKSKELYDNLYIIWNHLAAITSHSS